MCEYCARELNPELINRLKIDLPDKVPSTGDAKTAGNAALVNADAAIASGNLQLQDEVVPFRPADDARSANTWGGEDAFVFAAPSGVTGNRAMVNWVEFTLSNLTEQEKPSMSMQTIDTPETAFWTYSTVASFEDWYF